MKLSACETIVDEQKFVETTQARITANPTLNVACAERLEKYRHIKTKQENGNK